MGQPIDEVHAMRAERRSIDRDRAVAALFAAQHDIATAGQLEQLGLGRGSRGRWLQRGRLFTLYRGVYSRTAKPTHRGLLHAAVLAGGTGAAASHRAAGALHGMLTSEFVEITVPGGGRKRERLAVHRAPLPEDEVEETDGIRVTIVPRTLLDLASVLREGQLERAMNEAEVLRLGAPLSLAAVLERYPNRKGTATLRGIVLTGRTRSDLEAAFTAFRKRYRIPPPPMQNQYIEGYECDFIWPDARLIVELDARSTHDTTLKFETDRLRDRRLDLAGWHVIRVTARMLEREAEELARDLRDALSRSYSR